MLEGLGLFDLMKGRFVSGALAWYSEIILLIITSKGSAAATSAMASDVSPSSLCALAERADLGWFVGSLALKR